MTLRRKTLLAIISLIAVSSFSASGIAQRGSRTHNPTWWDKYTYIANNGALGTAGTTASVTVGSNVDVSNECGPQSETFIAINPLQSKTLAAGSNEIFRLPMRGYFSSDGGENLGGVYLPLPSPKRVNLGKFSSRPLHAFE